MKQTSKHTDKSLISNWVADEEGSMTVLSIFFVLVVLIVGGMAMDFNKAISRRTQLQTTADTAAHAALYTRETQTEDEAKSKAMATVSGMLPESQFGVQALLKTDINFGKWDLENASFVVDESSKTAVRVRAQMVKSRGNASRNLLLHLIDRKKIDIGTESVYSTYFPGCFTEGFVAEQVVDIQSNNSFGDGFCIHSNNYVSLNQNNYFEPGTVVSMPNINDLDMPNSGFEKNEGLGTALRQGEYRLRILGQLPNIIASLWNGEAEHLPPYVTPNRLHDLDPDDFPSLPEGANAPKGSKDSFTPFNFKHNAVNRLICYSSQGITLQAGVYKNFVFVTDCEVKFANGVVLEDVVVATTNTSATSLNSPQGLQIGRDDDCAPGGGATLMTMGGFKAAASLSVFNGQILAEADIIFSANADGVKGASFVSNGEIEGTSNMNMGFCKGNGMENAYRAPYFRMVN